MCFTGEKGTPWKKSQPIFNYMYVILVFIFFYFTPNTPLDGSGYSRVEMGMPDLFIRCSAKQTSQQEYCVWMTTSEDIETVTTDAAVWRMPSGSKAHSGIVSAATFLLAFLSSLFIVLAAIYSSDANHTKNLKKP